MSEKGNIYGTRRSKRSFHNHFMDETFDTNFRKMSAGEWYWIDKAVIQKSAGSIGFSGVAIYNFLASMADENQKCFPSQKYIAERLGCSRATVNRAIKVLEKYRLIFVEKRNYHHHVYSLLDIPCNTEETSVSHQCNQSVQKGDTNKTKEQEINNKSIVRVKKNNTDDFPIKSKEELLASDIADALDDRGNIKTYHSFASKYPESFLRQILSEVKRTPEHKIRKSRKALFMYLVNYYAHKNN